MRIRLSDALARVRAADARQCGAAGRAPAEPPAGWDDRWPAGPRQRADRSLPQVAVLDAASRRGGSGLTTTGRHQIDAQPQPAGQAR